MLLHSRLEFFTVLAALSACALLVTLAVLLRRRRRERLELQAQVMPHLRKIKLFGRLTSAQLQLLAGAMEMERFSKGGTCLCVRCLPLFV